MQQLAGGLGANNWTAGCDPADTPEHPALVLHILQLAVAAAGAPEQLPLCVLARAGKDDGSVLPRFLRQLLLHAETKRCVILSSGASDQCQQGLASSTKCFQTLPLAAPAGWWRAGPSGAERRSCHFVSVHATRIAPAATSWTPKSQQRAYENPNPIKPTPSKSRTMSERSMKSECSAQMEPSGRL